MKKHITLLALFLGLTLTACSGKKAPEPVEIKSESTEIASSVETASSSEEIEEELPDSDEILAELVGCWQTGENEDHTFIFIYEGYSWEMFTAEEYLLQDGIVYVQKDCIQLADEKGDPVEELSFTDENTLINKEGAFYYRVEDLDAVFGLLEFIEEETPAPAAETPVTKKKPASDSQSSGSSTQKEEVYTESGASGYYYDSYGDVWYWNGKEEVFIGSGNDYYIEDGELFEANDSWDDSDDYYYDEDDYDEEWMEPGDYDDQWEGQGGEK